ncbi:hypothetical protein IQ266_14655 [filamentous cyanobacterium LEGE 11480]|uniref:Uncharacterized protein n=1 Tax=Romeriopsis navalis LEGE 11480 TaxID=2777977 RepID=A0A928VLT7_9CYAN|nr:hypothetical protein [Romeriopsis navalis]MBE9030973.1 hypothetical protein [Romeriopsis navalis LEGE 11480]
MTTVTEIEAVIRQLSEDDARRLSVLLLGYLDDAWDVQMQADVEGGRLDRLMAQAEAAIAVGNVRDLDVLLNEAP